MNEIEALIDVTYLAAQAAYTVMNLPAPPLVLPDGYTPVGTINANPQQGAAAMARATPDQQRLAIHMIRESSIFGMVLYDAATTTAIVAIRGTETLMDWVDDIDAIPVVFAPFPAAGLVHMGFLVVYENIRENILSLLKQCAGVSRIVITGHSLGGALAVLCAFDVLKNAGTGLVPEVHTFAGPRTVDPHFAGQFDALIPICHRVVNFMDVVPQLPLPPLYEHVGTEILVHGGFRPLDVTYAHHLTTHLAGLHKLPGAPPAGYQAPVPPAAKAAVAEATVAGAQAVLAAAAVGAAKVQAAAEAAEGHGEVVVKAEEAVTR